MLERDFGMRSPGRHALLVADEALAPGGYRARARAGVNVAERMLVKVR